MLRLGAAEAWSSLTARHRRQPPHRLALTCGRADLYFSGMQSRRDATLNLASLLHHAPGSELEVEAEGLLEPEQELLDADGLRLAGPIAWHVHVVNTGGDDDFVADGQMSARAVLECRRCLTEVEVDVEAEFVYPMSYRPSDLPLRLEELEEVEEELLVFGRPDVDFAQLLTELIAIEVPLTALCREDCLGLNEDGVNLNEHPELAVDRPAAAPQDGAVRIKGLDEALRELERES